MPKKPRHSSLYKRSPLKSRSYFVLILCLLIFGFFTSAASTLNAASVPERPASQPPPATIGTGTPALPAVLPTPRAAGARQCIWEGVDRIIAIGDLHCDYVHFITILKHEEIGLIDDDLHWIGGKTHLVQIGDVMDRGMDREDRAKDIFDLIKRLEKEALEAGGMVHMLIGNHEEMNITGIAFRYADYVSIKQFKDFLPEKYKRDREREFKRRTEGRVDIDNEWKKLMEDEGPRGDDARFAYVENFNLLYGRWIALEHNAVIKINDTVFVHGGIGEKYSSWPLKDINNLYYTEFRKVLRRENFDAKILLQEDSPLWFRLLASPEWDEKIYAPQVDKILANLGAKQIVIAHTPYIKDQRYRFDKKVWVTDTGISRVYRGFLSALIINSGNFKPWRLNY